MERFSSRAKSVVGVKSTTDKIESISEYAVTMSIDGMDIGIGQFGDLSGSDQLYIINKYLDNFIQKYGDDIKDILGDFDIEVFINTHKQEIVKSIRKFMYSIYGR